MSRPSHHPNTERERSKQARGAAIDRLALLPLDDRQLINKKYRTDRLAGKITLSYSRWLIKLFEITDSGASVDRALSLINLHLSGRPIDGTASHRKTEGLDRADRPTVA